MRTVLGGGADGVDRASEGGEDGGGFCGPGALGGAGEFHCEDVEPGVCEGCFGFVEEVAVAGDEEAVAEGLGEVFAAPDGACGGAVRVEGGEAGTSCGAEVFYG